MVILQFAQLIRSTGHRLCPIKWPVSEMKELTNVVMFTLFRRAEFANPGAAILHVFPVPPDADKCFIGQFCFWLIFFCPSLAHSAFAEKQ